MTRNVVVEGCAVGAVMALLFLALRRLLPDAPAVAAVALAGLAGHLGFEALGLNAAFCRTL